MIKWKYVLIVSLLLLGCMMSCDDIFEKDITDASITLLVPSDGAVVTSDSVQFWWEGVDGANGYCLHVVSPSFENAAQLWLDTCINQTTWEVALPTGSYAWEVFAYNAGYQTDYFYASFEVDTAGQQVDTTNISDQVLQLVYPADGGEVIDSKVDFYWQQVRGATSYEFMLARPNFEAPVALIDSILTGNQLTVNDLAVGDYEWKVKAMNDRYEVWSLTNLFSFDSIAVQDISDKTIVVNYPKNAASQNDGVIKFGWEELEGVISYELRLYTPNYTNAVSLRDTTITAPSLSWELGAGSYEWQIRGVNDRYETAWTDLLSLTLLDANDLSEVSVQLLSPADGVLINEASLDLYWEAVPKAEEYELRIVTPSFGDDFEQIVHRETLTSIEKTVSLDSGTYEWGVKALNATSETAWSVREIIVDPQ